MKQSEAEAVELIFFFRFVQSATHFETMSQYRQLLEATIAHLERLEELGVAHVAVQTQTFAQLHARTRSQANREPAPLTPANRLSPPHRSEKVSAGKVESIRTNPRESLPPTPAPVTLTAKLSPTAKAKAFGELKEQAQACQKCAHLAAHRHTVVFGAGNPDARILFVGEAPGADEDRTGEPFVGLAGELLTKIITAMGLSRESVYIANILKCRPDMPAGASGNRKPRPDEMTTCIPWLQAQIDLIQPEVMVALGATAAEGLLGKPVMITRMRGQWQTYRGIPLMPTYHPAYLLRNQIITEKRKVWEDMLAVMERIKMPITARQREFFQKN